MFLEFGANRIGGLANLVIYGPRRIPLEGKLTIYVKFSESHLTFTCSKVHTRCQFVPVFITVRKTALLFEVLRTHEVPIIGLTGCSEKTVYATTQMLIKQKLNRTKAAPYGQLGHDFDTNRCTIFGRKYLICSAVLCALRFRVDQL
jgi:hypothetical protein